MGLSVDGRAHGAPGTDARMRRLAMITAVIAIAPMSVLGVVLTARSWWEGLTMAVGYLLAFGVLREWSLEGYPRRAVLALAFTGAGWTIGSFSAASPISFVPFSLVGALLIVRMRARRLWLAAFAALVAGIGAGAFAFHPFGGSLVVEYLVIPAAGTLFIAGVLLVSEQAWQLARRLERAREAEAELAVARERVRFAGDLHDIQGHSLHVIKLKTVLASHLVRTDPARAEQELGEVRRLADETIAHARALAYAQHELNPAAELENARRLVEAAGISVAVQDELGTGPAPHPLLAQVLREGTTNLLRHATPTAVTIRMGPELVEIANDGAGDGAGDGSADTAAGGPVDGAIDGAMDGAVDGGSASLRGLARLRARIEDAGGTLGIDRPPGRFVVTARLAPGATARPVGDAS